MPPLLSVVAAIATAAATIVTGVGRSRSSRAAAPTFWPSIGGGEGEGGAGCFWVARMAGNGCEEHQERSGLLEKSLHVIIRAVETTQDAEHKSTVLDDLTKITKSINNPLHLGTVVTNREVSLDKHPKLSMSFAIA
jgi:hypothetical protein